MVRALVYGFMYPSSILALFIQFLFFSPYTLVSSPDPTPKRRKRTWPESSVLVLRRMRICADKAMQSLVLIGRYACDRTPATGSKANLESDWSAKCTDSIAMLHSCGKLVI